MPSETVRRDDIKIIKGNPRLLLMAPHGVATRPKDDINTDKLTYQIAHRLGCCAIINDVVKRDVCDFNDVNQASQHKAYMSAIRQIVDVFEPTMVIWLHGISDGNLKRELIAMGVDAMVHCLIGYGQPDRPTARENTVTELARLFGSNAINALVARDDSSYCGWSESYMNQWFRLQRYALHDVESIQLEFAYKTIRRSERLETSSRNIARTLAELIDFVPHATRRIGG